jgi:hypothetical protein
MRVMTNEFVINGIRFVVGGKPRGVDIAPGQVHIYAHERYKSRFGKSHVIEDGAFCADTEAERERSIRVIITAFERARAQCDAVPTP